MNIIDNINELKKKMTEELSKENPDINLVNNLKIKIMTIGLALNINNIKNNY